MNKNGNSKTKYCIQSEKHPLQTSLGLCSLMEHQSLVDIAICCGNNTLHAHKVVLAANSPLFREELEKNSCIEQVIISGCDFSVIRSIVEFMYCGETTVSEDYIKYLVAAAKLFQMKSLENLSLERTDYQFTGDVIVLPKPQFLSKKPKYPTYPFNANTSLPPNNILKPLNYTVNNLYKPHKVKRKFRLEAEHQACIKEAHASRLAIANLKKEIASAPQANTFIIEETCTETTVENFIPHPEQSGYVEVDYNNIDNQVFVSPNNFNQETSKSANMIQLALQNNGQALTADKIKHILGNEVPANVEIMFKTSDGSFVTVTDEVLQNLSTKEGLQYQVVDENGQVGEIQELQVLGRDALEKINKINAQDLPKDLSSHGSDLSTVTNPEDYISTHFLEGSQIVFNTSESNPTVVDPVSVENPKNFTGGPVFETADKDMELLALNTEELKPTFPDDSQMKVNGFYDFGEDLKPAASQLENDMTITVDDKYRLGDLTSLSPRKTRSSLKFSPDMFFADIPTTGADADTEECDQKKFCPGRRKKAV
ncbi:uncharacterized protein LOC108903788 [Anoplophora glabripennis]|uniref:uncharacterized protein LOC108903788 n=1 Tax=Anoplophora glabripennis TaxID=217634 RepID=UPI0008738EE1|nr:uncharacterized protein LOC108903788 [Anoplophora glabripennis]